MTTNRFAFKKGWGQVPHDKTKEVRERIMTALNLKARNNFYIRLRGEIEPKVTEAEALEKIFGDYGITEVWGE